MKLNSILLPISWCLYLPLLQIGNVFLEDRFVLFVFPINFILFIFIFLILSILLCLNRNCIGIKIGFVSILPFIFAMILSFGFYNLSLAGIEKYLNSIIIGFIGSSLLLISANNGKISLLLRITVYFLLTLFIAAIFWKLKFGFWDRHIIYFLNGPIVFGRIMAVGFFISLLFIKESRIYTVYSMIFLFGVFWSMSKGPILAILVCMLFIAFKKNKKYFILLTFFLMMTIFPIISGLVDLSETPLKRIQIGFQVLSGISDSSSAAGSLDLRKDMIISTINVIQDNYVTGVGPGNWSKTLNSYFTYPHNIFLEVYSELGILTGSLFLIPYCLFIFFYKNFLFPIPLFFLISHQVSGDVADARWLLLFSVVVFSISINNKYIKNSNVLEHKMVRNNNSLKYRKAGNEL